MRIATALFSAFIAGASALTASAHEFWISPETYMIGPQDQLVAHLRVGETFSGASYSYLPQRFESFDVVMNGRRTPVEGRMGDTPAMTIAPPGEGLAIITHQTTDSFVTYADPEKFVNFVIHKDFVWALEEHNARGLPGTGFRERYSRYGKSLVAVGHGEGLDLVTGLETEIVAEANPYTDSLRGGMPIRVLYQGAPRADVQVEVFAKDEGGEVMVTTYYTDALGRVSIPVEPGVEYLFDAVVMRAIEPEDDNGPVWESLWASLTFKVPAR